MILSTVLNEGVDNLMLITSFRGYMKRKRP